MAKIERIGVIGAGQMGAGIAQVSAAAGYKTVIWDPYPGVTDKAQKGIAASLAKFVEKEKLTADAAEQVKKRITVADGIKGFDSTDLVIEAIAENTEAKVSLFKELSGILPPTAILATNTSSISITKLAATFARPEQFIGMHFMNPVPIMQLIEIIRGLQTSDDTYKSACEVSSAMGKTTVLGIDGPGFVVNRILCPMVNEAIFLLQEGVKAEDIDQAMKLGTNQPMGPLALADFVGLDTLLSIMRILHAELGEDKYRPCPLLVKYVEAGWYGKKTKRGFYRYE